MYSEKEITRRYKAMLVQYSDDKPSGVNCYVCTRCKHVTKTVDVDPGVTPFIHECEACKGNATSSMYRDIAPDKKCTQEWFRPEIKQLLKWRKNGSSMIEHVLQGGLDVRKITAVV